MELQNLMMKFKNKSRNNYWVREFEWGNYAILR